MEFPEGKAVVLKGTPGDEFFIVKEGTAVVRDGPEGKVWLTLNNNQAMIMVSHHGMMSHPYTPLSESGTPGPWELLWGAGAHGRRGPRR